MVYIHFWGYLEARVASIINPLGTLPETSTFEEIQSLKYFLNHWCIHTPLSHVRLCLSLSILPFESVKVGDHFDMHLGY